MQIRANYSDVQSEHLMLRQANKTLVPQHLQGHENKRNSQQYTAEIS